MKKKQVAAIETLDEIPTLTLLCRQGRLFDVQQWISDGRPVNFTVARPKQKREQTPLMVAFEMGFHSLAEVLLRGGAEVHTTYRYCPMHIALSKKRLDFVQLLVAHGYNLHLLDLVELFQTRSPEIIRWAVEQGLDITHNMSLARALIERVRPAVNIVRDYRLTLAGVQVQANIALRRFCHDGNRKWVSLLLWAGADPKEIGNTDPTPPSYESAKSAIGFATELGHTELLSLKPLREATSIETANEILQHGSLPESFDILTAFFLEGFSPNDQLDGGCSRLQLLIEGLRFGSDDPLSQILKRECSVRLNRMKSIHFLAKFGARWTPTDGEIASARRSLLEVKADYAVEIVWLSHRYGMATTQTLRELLRTPAMERHTAGLKTRIQDLMSSDEKCGAAGPS